jgi:hypothetical protein
MRILQIAVLAAAVGCTTQSSPQEVVCAEPGSSRGLGITLRDTRTGAAGPFYDVHARAMAVDFQDSLSIPAIDSPPQRDVFWVVSNREGTYSLTVSARGYQVWSKSGVAVHRGPCAIIPVVLTVDLRPVS